MVEETIKEEKIEEIKTDDGFEEINPGVWKPEAPGDVLEGVYVEKRTDVGDFDTNAYYIENKEGIFMVWGTTILASRMALCKIMDYVRITYTGLETSKKGAALKMFKVERKIKE